MSKSYICTDASGWGETFNSDEGVKGFVKCSHCLEEILSMNVGDVFVVPDIDDEGDVWERIA